MAKSEDYELGDVVAVERRPRAGVVVSVRLSQEEADRLQALAQQRESTLSRLAREAITAYLGMGGSTSWPGVPWTGTTQYITNLELTPIAPGPMVVTTGDVRDGRRQFASSKPQPAD